MSRILPASKTVELLDEFKKTVEDFAARADKLNEEFRLQTAREQRRYEAAVEQEAAASAVAEVQANGALETARNAAGLTFERRRIWIGKAYQSSKELGLKRVEDRIGGRKYELQRKMLQAEKDRESAMSAVVSAGQQFHNHLAAEQEALAGLERNAQRSFHGYTGFKRLFQRAYETSEGNCAPDQDRLLAELRELIGKAAGELGRFRGFTLLRVFRFLILWVLFSCCVFALVPLARYFGVTGFGFLQAGAVAAGALALVGILRLLAVRKAHPLADSLSKTLARARRVHAACQEQSELHYQQELERVQQEHAATTQGVDRQLKQTLSQAGDLRVACRMRTDERAVHANSSNERNRRGRLERLERARQEAAQQLKQTAEIRAKALTDSWEQKRANLVTARDSQWRALEAEWRSRIEPLYQVLEGSAREADELFPPWDSAVWRNWKPSGRFIRAAKFARLEVDVTHLCAGAWKERGLQLPGPAELKVPICLAYPEQGSILFETSTAAGHDEAIGALNNIILRLLSTAPPGRLNFTILDPVGLGQNFAGVMHLADYEEQIINSRIWTQSGQIEQKLADLNEHMEKVIQMYLRNEYATIAEYNEQAGVIAEKYHFLVVADFPANFTETAAKRLLSIAASGARCGVYTLIHWDQRQPLPPGLHSR